MASAGSSPAAQSLVPAESASAMPTSRETSVGLVFYEVDVGAFGKDFGKVAQASPLAYYIVSLKSVDALHIVR